MPRSDAMQRLIGFDLAIASDCPVPGALLDPSPSGLPDLTVTTLPHAVPLDRLYGWEQDTLTFSAPGVASYGCRRDAITVAAAPRADPDMVTALLIATALPAVLWLRGDTMLHAAGIVSRSGGTAIALAGPSGVGKSALTAELLDAGCTLLADDSIRLRLSGGRIEASGLAGGYHLAGANAETRGFQPLPATRSIRTATIGAVMILGRTGDAASLTKLNPVAALERLVANQHRPKIPAIIGRRAETLATMAFIARHCAVYEWHRPHAALGVVERDLLLREGLW